MIEYNLRIDQQISDALRRDGRVPIDGLPGLDSATGAAMLAEYVRIHAAEVPLLFDGAVLTWARVPAAESVPTGHRENEASPPAGRSAPSPVDQVLSAPGGRALLDFEPSGPPVGRGMWLLPLLLGIVGGLIGWAVVRDQNPRVARKLLVTGVVVQLVSACAGVALAAALSQLAYRRSDVSAGSAQWAASSTGRPVFYYFGTAT